MSVLLLTGPPASGKNTIAELVAKRRERCAVIDVDLVRQMVVQPNKVAWQGEEGSRQQVLGVENACALARNFAAAEFDVVVSDVVTDAVLDQYRRHLPDVVIRTIVLLPSEDEIHARLLSRPDYLSRGEVTAVYQQQANFTGYDEKLDTTSMDPDDVVDWVLQHWHQSVS